MDRIFLDANVLFSASYREDAPLQQLCRLADVELVTSTYAIQETLANIHREEQLERLERLLTEVRVVSAWDHISLPNDIVLPEKDIPIMQAAIAAGATHLITGDKRHFGKHFGQTIAGLEVLRPATYLRRGTR